MLNEEMVAGDSGGSVDNIAQGVTTGSVTSPGPGLTTKKKKKSKTFAEFVNEASRYDNNNGKPDGDNDENNNRAERRDTVHDKTGESHPRRRGKEHESEERRKELKPGDARKKPSQETPPGSKKDTRDKEMPSRRSKPRATFKKQD